MITVRVLADSINPSGSRLTSFLLTYPRYIHSEFMTHRVFSRNAASSRAIPFGRALKDVNESPAMPEYWGGHQKGMQAGEELSPEQRIGMKTRSLNLLRHACAEASNMHENGLHKSICNRYLEPWAHITVLATATWPGLSNFFALRAHPDAEPTFQVLAYRMLSAYMGREPSLVKWGGWHVPDFTSGNADAQIASIIATKEDEVKIATARCARLSYLTHEGDHSPWKDIEMHDRLLASKHFSPFEHCAQAKEPGYHGSDWTTSFSNFDQPGDEDGCGWQQYRKMIEDENQTDADLIMIMDRKPAWITGSELTDLRKAEWYLKRMIAKIERCGNA